MMELKVFDNLAEAIALYQQLGDKLEPDMAMALNRTSRGVKTDETKLVSQRGIQRSELQDWSFRNARPGDLESQAVVRGRHLGLEKFGPDPSRKMEGQTKGGVSVNLMGKTVQFKHAFLGGIYGKELKVWQRKQGANPKVETYTKGGKTVRLKGRFPVNRLTFVSVPQIADDDDIVDIVVQNAEGRFLKQFDHLVNRLVENFG